MSKIGVRELKKALQKHKKEELINLVTELSKKFTNVNEFLLMQHGEQNPQEILQKYKDIIEKEFIEGRTRGFPKLRFSVARKAVNDFKKINDEPRYVAEILLCYAGAVSHFSSEFGPNEEKFYTVPEELFEESLRMAQRYGFEEELKEEAFEILSNACDGWGHTDSLSDSYYQVFDD
ncbi:MAG: anaerobic ribonucleoside-triphosphate reductase [Saprospiraceae bacterium]|jgi:anaerobic ribonucleoside-triphosphate reductase